MYFKHQYKARLKIINKYINKNKKKHSMHTYACNKHKKAEVAILILVKVD